ncbi:MAG: class I SAM-dependent methyltransferase [Armatimonadetes bacterium]|nr:class I SAM-dependent methyltransferase [Armatimonadota bacterium]
MSRFDTLAPQWDTNPVRAALGTGVADAMRREVPFAPDWRIMDFGAGTGLVTLRLLDSVAEVVAVDCSTGMLDVLDDKLSAAGLTQVTTHRVDLTRAAWDGEPVDAVVSSMTLHHIADVPALLARLVGAVKPGGWLALADLDAEDGSFHGPDVDDVHHQGFQRETMAAWLRAAGCGEVRVADAHRVTRPDVHGIPRTYGVFVAVGRR